MNDQQLFILCIILLVGWLATVLYYEHELKHQDEPDTDVNAHEDYSAEALGLKPVPGYTAVVNAAKDRSLNGKARRDARKQARRDLIDDHMATTPVGDQVRTYASEALRD